MGAGEAVAMNSNVDDGEAELERGMRALQDSVTLLKSDLENFLEDTGLGEDEDVAAEQQEEEVVF